MNDNRIEDDTILLYTAVSFERIEVFLWGSVMSFESHVPLLERPTWNFLLTSKLFGSIFLFQESPSRIGAFLSRPLRLDGGGAGVEMLPWLW